MPTLFREVRRDLHKPPPSVRQAFSDQDIDGFRRIARQRIRHLNRWRQPGRTALEYLCQVLSGMLTAREKQRDLVPFARRNHPGGEDTGAFAAFLRDVSS